MWNGDAELVRVTDRVGLPVALKELHREADCAAHGLRLNPLPLHLQPTNSLLHNALYSMGGITGWM